MVDHAPTGGCAVSADKQASSNSERLATEQFIAPSRQPGRTEDRPPDGYPAADMAFDQNGSVTSLIHGGELVAASP
jgi:hypothetical protein